MVVSEMLSDDDKTRLRAAAIHEAAHVMAAFHWGVSVGREGVWLDSEHGFRGHSAVVYDRTMRHADGVGTLIGPFAECKFWQDHNAARDRAEFLIGGFNDFQRLLELDYLSVSNDDVQQRRYCGFSEDDRRKLIAGERLLLLWSDPQQPVPGTSEKTLDLVRDTEAVLCTYWTQIESFADVLLNANTCRLPQGEVIAWRDEHFRRRVVTLTTKTDWS
jgi:hypothetical protein